MGFENQPITNAQHASNLLARLIENPGDFLLKKFYKEAEKAYRANPNDLLSCYLFARAESMINIENSDVFFKNIVISKINKNVPENNKKEIYVYYSGLLYGNHKYKEALESFEKGYKLDEIIKATASFMLGLGIYFENNKYNEIIFILDEIKKNPELSSLKLPSLVFFWIDFYQAMSWYYLGNKEKSLYTLKHIMNYFELKQLNRVNIADFLEICENFVTNHLFKPEATEKEKRTIAYFKELLESTITMKTKIERPQDIEIKFMSREKAIDAANECNIKYDVTLTNLAK